jgi:hypothetical protein
VAGHLRPPPRRPRPFSGGPESGDGPGLGIGIPDHTTFSRRRPGLALANSLAEARRSGPIHVVIDATWLKVHGAGEWLAEAHGGRGRRTWRKLHLAVDPGSGEILASV